MNIFYGTPTKYKNNYIILYSMLNNILKKNNEIKIKIKTIFSPSCTTPTNKIKMKNENKKGGKKSNDL